MDMDVLMTPAVDETIPAILIFFPQEREHISSVEPQGNYLS